MLRQLTQAELACLAGVSRGVVIRLERASAASVRMDSALRVLRALGVRLRIGGETAVSRPRGGEPLLLH